jgi:ribosomal protein S18 acetylase RimI-like enzyme
MEYASVLTELGAETFVDAHKDSAPAHEIESYLNERYSINSIRKEVTEPANIYHVIEYNGTTAGFSKMMLNSTHPSLALSNVSKMDQLYLAKSYHGLGLGAELLTFNIEYSKAQSQSSMWLIVWAGNMQAIAFYEKFGFKVLIEERFQLTETHTSPSYIMWLDYFKPTPIPTYSNSLKT